MRSAVFLDRDDTLVGCRAATANTPHPGDLIDPDAACLNPGAAGACRRLADAGFVLIVVSNQGCVARGLIGPAGVQRVNQRVGDLMFREAGVRPDAFYFCPFHPRGVVPAFTREHEWRKPAPGMFLAAAADLSLDLRSSWAVGDAPRDSEAAIAAGIVPERAMMIGPPPCQWGDLAAAAAHILATPQFAPGAS